MKDFTITIDGKGVAPNSIRLGDLFDVLYRFDSAIEAVASNKKKLDESPELRLVEVRPGSAGYRVETSDDGLSAAAECLDAITRRDLSGLPIAAKNALLDLHAKAAKNNWSITFSNRGAFQPTTIDKSIEFRLDAVLSGRTTIGAYLERAGGTLHRSAKLILMDGRLLTATVATKELTEELGRRLFKFLSLTGDATWSGREMRLTDFKITEIGDYSEDANITETLEELGELWGDRWNDIDPDEYISDLRSGVI